MKRVIFLLLVLALAIGGAVLWLQETDSFGIKDNQRIFLTAEGIGVTYNQALTAAKERLGTKVTIKNPNLLSTNVWPVRVEKKSKRVWMKRKNRLGHWYRRRVRVEFFVVKVKGSFVDTRKRS